VSIEIREMTYESPIEQRLGVALIDALRARYESRAEHVILTSQEEVVYRRDLQLKTIKRDAERRRRGEPDRRRHRFDFALRLTSSVAGRIERVTRLDVECDGAEFHEAERDAMRDSILFDEGWRVLRFTGKQIYANAAACAEATIVELERLHASVNEPPPACVAIANAAALKHASALLAKAKAMREEDDAARARALLSNLRGTK